MVILTVIRITSQKKKSLFRITQIVVQILIKDYYKVNKVSIVITIQKKILKLKTQTKCTREKYKDIFICTCILTRLLPLLTDVFKDTSLKRLILILVISFFQHEDKHGLQNN